MPVTAYPAPALGLIASASAVSMFLVSTFPKSFGLQREKKEPLLLTSRCPLGGDSDDDGDQRGAAN
jgi:hypothetical protein